MRSRPLELKLTYWAACSGLVFLVGYVISFGILGHNHPPPNPNYTPAQLAARYFTPYKGQIEAGMAICMFVGVFYMPWAAAMSRVMTRPENRQPLLSSLSLVGGAVTAWLVAEFPGKILTAARFGQGHAYDQYLTWHEAWNIYDMTYMITGVEMVAVGIYILTDRTETRIFPNWVGYLSFFSVVSFFSESWMPFVHGGIFALDGGWNFWVGFPDWLIWFGAVSFFMIRYLRGQVKAAETGAMTAAELDARVVEVPMEPGLTNA
jgi:hypothetical protein